MRCPLFPNAVSIINIVFLRPPLYVPLEGGGGISAPIIGLGRQKNARQ